MTDHEEKIVSAETLEEIRALVASYVAQGYITVSYPTQTVVTNTKTGAKKPMFVQAVYRVRQGTYKEWKEAQRPGINGLAD